MNASCFSLFVESHSFSAQDLFVCYEVCINQCVLPTFKLCLLSLCTRAVCERGAGLRCWWGLRKDRHPRQSWPVHWHRRQWNQCTRWTDTDTLHWRGAHHSWKVTLYCNGQELHQDHIRATLLWLFGNITSTQHIIFMMLNFSFSLNRYC